VGDDLFSWKPPPAAPPRVEVSFGADDKSHREKVLELLRDGAWHTQQEMQRVGGLRYGARVHELRAAGLNVEAEERGPGVFHWRLSSQPAPVRERKPTWRERALAAEARVLELEAQLGGA
jgi:hypothetical protein